MVLSCSEIVHVTAVVVAFVAFVTAWVVHSSTSSSLYTGNVSTQNVTTDAKRNVIEIRMNAFATFALLLSHPSPSVIAPDR